MVPILFGSTNMWLNKLSLTSYFSKAGCWLILLVQIEMLMVFDIVEHIQAVAYYFNI